MRSMADTVMIERQKATRLLKKLRKRLAACTTAADSNTLERQIHETEVDLNYALYCPLDQKYIALYANKSREEDSEEGHDSNNVTAKPPMWAEVERRMEKGTLSELRNGASQSSAQELGHQEVRRKANGSAARKDDRGEDRERGKPNKPGGPRKSERDEGGDVEGDESDGGFFEE